MKRLFIAAAFLSLLFPVVSGQALSFSEELIGDLRYRCVGPTRGGRVTTVEGVAGQPSVFYMGATGGGVWKTTDYGQSWNNISDGYFATPSIGAIQVFDANPDIIYVGTGSDGIRSNVITGRGVYKSEDAGESWKLVGLEKTGQTGAVEVHPENPDIVFVASIGNAFGPNPERGIYRSTNGGDSWEKVLFVSEKTGFSDLEICPDNPDILYAAAWTGERKPWTIISGSEEGGIYKSVDGGTNWQKLAGGLPTGIIGKSDLAVSPAAPNMLWVLMEAEEGSEGLYVSEDYGETFRRVSTYSPLLDRPFYYCNIDADPTNPDNLFVNSTGYWLSTDGGENWHRGSTPHGDNHDMWINPNNADLYIQCNDGGANVTRDGGQTWSSQMNQPTAELYQVNVDEQFPYWLYAGQQDNSTLALPSERPFSVAAGPSAYMLTVGGCETGPAVPKPGNPDIVYSNCKGRFGRYNKKTGQEQQYYVGAANMYGHNPKDLKYRFQRVSPIHVSPHNPDKVYHASQYLHVTYDDGITWETISPDLTAFEPDKQVISGSPITRDITGEEFYSTIYAVQESPIQKDLIWVGANDGPIHVTKDGGKNWKDVTPSALPSGGRVQTIEASPHNPAKAYAAVLLYQLNDWRPHIYKTEDYGESWTLINKGIPVDYPARVVREDPEKEGLLYAGTEFGMFVSFNDGEQWEELQYNLPVTPVTDMKIFRGDIILSTMGRSFWIMDNIDPLRELKEVSGAQPYMFSPEPAIRDRSRYYGGRSNVPDLNGPSAVIDYYLPEAAKSIVVEVYTQTGELVDRMLNGAEMPAAPESIEEIPAYLQNRQMASLSKEAGIHRFNWDMRVAGSWSASGRRGYSGSGPMLVPAKYRIVMIIDGEQELTGNIDLLPDPRVVRDNMNQQAFEAQFELAIQVRDMISHGRWVLRRLETRKEELEGVLAAGKKLKRREQEELDALTDLYYRFESRGGRYPMPVLMSQMSYLNSMINRADQMPGKDAYDRYEELNELLKKYEAELNTIL